MSEKFKGLTPLVLVFTHDYFTLSAALAKRHTGEIISQAYSTNLDLEAALEEVLQDLRSSGYRLPKRAFMAVSYAVSGLFELPVDPKKPRPDKQMQELVRYELEAHLAEFKDLWSIEAVTQGRGYINQQQRTTTLQLLNEKRSSGHAGLVRFSDIALEQGFINVHQRDEVLDLQNEMTADDELLECGWQPQVLAQQDAPDLQYWYGAGIDRLKRNAWARRFRHDGIKLVNFFPIEEMGIPSASGHIEEHQAILIFNIGAEQVHCFRVEKDQWNQAQITAMTSEQTEGLSNINILSEIGLSLLTGSVEKIYLQFNHKENKPSQESLEQLTIKFDKPTQLLTGSDNKLMTPLSLLAQLVGQYKQDNCLIAIAAEDPGPPLWKDISFLRYAIPVVIILAMLCNEIYTSYSIWSLDKELVELKLVTRKQSQINSQMSAVMSVKNRTETEISTREQELIQLQSEIEAGELFQSRTMLAHDLLKVIEESVNVEIMLNSITEPPRSKNPGFHLKAWAVSEPAAVRFISKLKRNLGDVSYKVVNELNQADKNRYGMSGQSIDLWLIPDAITKINRSKGI
ncbi:MAG: hypothetical protein JKY19_00755 [Alcanivoracaceae bacterium]|nr:hypothetical protein [Alcanivoracaceae bacterium]